MPTLALAGTYSFQSLYNDNWNVTKYDWARSSSIVLSMSIPIFRMGNFTKIRSTKLQISQLSENIDYTEKQLNMQVRSFVDNMKANAEQVAIVGSEIDDPSLTRLIEDVGALVVSDRYCFGSTPGREVIELRDDEPALRQICLHYMQTSECARWIADEKVLQRRETADRLAKEFGAEGIIYEQMKYCDYWGFERALVSHIMHDEYGWPVLSIDRLYNNGNSGQLRTRVQAFVESLEIKRIHKEEGMK